MFNFILGALVCSQVIMVNRSSEPWNNYDIKILKQSQVRCGQLYKESPCVKVFYKLDVQVYHVTCGAKK